MNFISFCLLALTLYKFLAGHFFILDMKRYVLNYLFNFRHRSWIFYGPHQIPQPNTTNYPLALFQKMNNSRWLLIMPILVLKIPIEIIHVKIGMHENTYILANYHSLTHTQQ